MSLIKLFNTHINKPRKSDPNYKPKPRIKPSSLGTPCKRKLYYDYNRVPEDQPFPLKARRIMELGNYVEDMFCDVFRSANLIVDYQNPDGSIPEMFGKPNPQFPVDCGELDIRTAFVDIVLEEGGQLKLAEIKSSNSRGYTNLQQPQTKHAIQAAIYLILFTEKLRKGDYAHITRLEGKKPPQSIYVIYYNKDNSYSKEFELDYKTCLSIFEHAVKTTLETQAFTKEKILPPKTPDYCKSCSWATKCSENFNI